MASNAQRDSIVRRMIELIEIGDALALLMVVATACSAYATWNTGQITRQLMLVSQRPYVGTETVKLARNASGLPSIMVDLRNFGTVQAEDVRLDEEILLDGNRLPLKCLGQCGQLAGVLSPGVPHRVYRHVPAEVYQVVVSGRAALAVKLLVRYRGPLQDQECYKKRFVYAADDQEFYSADGEIGCK